jgi:type IV pilus assembly protein PilY1
VGWYTDLPSSGERLVVDLRVELGTLEAATSIMSASACTVGGIGKRINLNVLTGLALPGTSGQVSRGYLPSLPVGISVLKLPDGSIVSVIADSAGANTSFPFPYITPAPQGKRVTWRELIQ